MVMALAEMCPAFVAVSTGWVSGTQTRVQERQQVLLSFVKRCLLLLPFYSCATSCNLFWLWSAFCHLRYDAGRHALVVDLEGRNFLLDPALVRRNDTSAASINEWTGEKLSKSDNVPDDIQPDTVGPLGNYAVQILWQDGFNQVGSALVFWQFW